MTKDISIIIINYNTYYLTSKCIASVIKHTQGISYEIILVDNASQECDANLFKEAFPDIILIKSPENVGFSKGNNLGIACAKGEYILLLNSDTELVENSIAQCLQRLRQAPEVGVLSCALVYPDSDKFQSIANKFPSFYIELLELLRITKLLSAKAKSNLLLGIYTNHEQESYVDWVWGAFFLMPKKVLAIFPKGQLPDDYFMYFEDVKWCYLIQKKGYKVLYYPLTRVIHHLSASTASLPDSYFAKLERIAQNEIHFLKTYKGKWYAYLLYILRSLKYRTLRGANFKKLSAFYWKYLNKIR